MWRRLWPAALLLGSAVALLARPGVGFYLPGVAPKDFVKGEAMDIKVRTQPYRRKDRSLRAATGDTANKLEAPHGSR